MYVDHKWTLSHLQVKRQNTGCVGYPFFFYPTLHRGVLLQNSLRLKVKPLASDGWFQSTRQVGSVVSCLWRLIEVNTAGWECCVLPLKVDWSQHGRLGVLCPASEGWFQSTRQVGGVVSCPLCLYDQQSDFLLQLILLSFQWYVLVTMLHACEISG